jgi:hypothetical protein
MSGASNMPLNLLHRAASNARRWLDRIAPPAATDQVAEGAGPKLFVPLGHFYSPMPDREEARRNALRLFDMSLRSIPGVDLNESAQLALFEKFRPFYLEQPFVEDPTANRRYHFDNAMYSYGDALFLYFMLRHLRPKRVIEIGSGYSSAVTLDTDELFLGGKLRCTFIEPYPDVLLSRLKAGDSSRIEILPVPVQEVELSRFHELESNDILFIDSTHVSKLGSDVNRIFFDILPALRPGVHVHFHDIYYPFEYPPAWGEEGRFWNEAYLLRAFLQYNSAFEIVLFATLMAIKYQAQLEELFPLCLRNAGASIWLRRKNDAAAEGR